MKNGRLISILIVFLFISLCSGDNTLTFYEKNLTLQQMLTYSDNSVVIRLVERLNVTCNVPNLTYRILYPNGTISNIITVYDYVHQIPHFNFCTDRPDIYLDDSRAPIIQVFDHLYFIESIPNYILVRYNKIIEENDTYSTHGMMIEWNGKITR